METKLDKLKAMKEDNALSIEEMEEIAGGTTNQCADDSRFLNVLLRGTKWQPERFGEYRFEYCGKGNRWPMIEDLKRAWSKCGIEAYLGSGQHSNQYYSHGELVTQEEAREIAMQNRGIQLKESDWKW